MATPQTHTPAPPADDEDDIVDPGAGRQTPPPSANGQPKKPASKHDPLVVDMARQYGLTDDEMEAIHPTLLKERVMGAFRRDHQVARELGGRQAGSPAAGGGGAASSPPPPPPAPEPEVDWGEVEIEDAAGAKVKRKMTDEDFAPGLVRIIKEQQKAIRSLQGEIQSDRQQRSWSQIYSMYDKALEGLGAWGKEMFGEGPGHEIDPTGAEMKRRTTLFGQLGLDFSKAVRQKD
ncbi:MAG TPA: hypothetical protein VFI13_00565, partial [Gemmatimonadales bacterium]|nr:hypothetical protein [Gemmatimonadales bacterium]